MIPFMLNLPQNWSNNNYYKLLLLITQLYFDGDPYISIDFAASITSGSFDATHRIIPLTTNAAGDFEGTWDIVIIKYIIWKW